MPRRLFRNSMADESGRESLPQATVVRRRGARLSVVWVIPILAAVVALGIAAQRILSQGPTITIVFKAAQGLEAGKTPVRYKDVNIGQVTAVRLSPDHRQVEVTAKMDRSVADLRVEDARFWVVEPRVTRRGIGHAALGEFHRVRGRPVHKEAAPVRRPGGAARDHRRSARPPVPAPCR